MCVYVDCGVYETKETLESSPRTRRSKVVSNSADLYNENLRHCCAAATATARLCVYKIFPINYFWALHTYIVYIGLIFNFLHDQLFISLFLGSHLETSCTTTHLVGVIRVNISLAESSCIIHSIARHQREREREREKEQSREADIPRANVAL